MGQLCPMIGRIDRIVLAFGHLSVNLLLGQKDLLGALAMEFSGNEFDVTVVFC